MLVLHPNNLTDMDGPLETKVCVGAGEGVLVLTGINVGIPVFVAINGVEVATPITTGVGVNMDGVGVAGRKAVGPGRG